MSRAESELYWQECALLWDYRWNYYKFYSDSMLQYNGWHNVQNLIRFWILWASPAYVQLNNFKCWKKPTKFAKLSQTSNDFQYQRINKLSNEMQMHCRINNQINLFAMFSKQKLFINFSWSRILPREVNDGNIFPTLFLFWKQNSPLNTEICAFSRKFNDKSLYFMQDPGDESSLD